MFGLHYGFGRLGVRLAWLGPRGGRMRGKQMVAQHPNIKIGGFMNIICPLSSCTNSEAVGSFRTFCKARVIALRHSPS